MVSLTLVTVNQHWLSSDHLPVGYVSREAIRTDGLRGISARAAQAASEAAIEPNRLFDFGTSDNDRMAAAEHGVQYLPQSSLSHDLIERFRDRTMEAGIVASWQGSLFESGTHQNLGAFLSELASTGARLATRMPFVPFGEMADFMRQHRSAVHNNIEQVHTLVDRFRDYKLGAPPHQLS